MKNEFSTRDLYLAALIYSTQKNFLRVDREARQCWFVFMDQSLCEKLQQQFFAKLIEVNAKEYADAIRTLKDLVFSNE